MSKESSLKRDPGRGRPENINRHVGARIRQRRIMLGLTQQQLAELVGVTYQQAHKYEHGINRVAAGRLYKMTAPAGPVWRLAGSVGGFRRPSYSRPHGLARVLATDARGSRSRYCHEPHRAQRSG
jgi:DNA-binding XRE family transcriptional regulator